MLMSVIRVTQHRGQPRMIEQPLGQHQSVAEHREVVTVGVAEIAVVDVRVRVRDRPSVMWMTPRLRTSTHDTSTWTRP